MALSEKEIFQNLWIAIKAKTKTCRDMIVKSCRGYRGVPAIIFGGMAVLLLLVVLINTGRGISPTANNTLGKIMRCGEAQRTPLMDNETVLRNLCSADYLVDVSDKEIKGSGAYRLSGGNVVWQGTARNESSRIITEFNVIITRNEKKETAKLTNLWIAPTETYNIQLDHLRDHPGNAEVKAGNVSNKSWSWTIKEAKGVPIVE